MEFQTAKPWILTSIKISPEFYEKCKSRGIKFSDAMRAGIALLLAERGEVDYDNNLNLMRKMRLIREQLEAKSQELDELKKNKTLVKKEITEDGFEIV